MRNVIYVLEICRLIHLSVGAEAIIYRVRSRELVFFLNIFMCCHLVRSFVCPIRSFVFYFSMEFLRMKMTTVNYARVKLCEKVNEVDKSHWPTATDNDAIHDDTTKDDDKLIENANAIVRRLLLLLLVRPNQFQMRTRMNL